MADNLMEKVVSLCKRRGFVFPGSEIYGGLNGTWDLGPLGVQLAKNIKEEWWKSVVFQRDDVVGLDSSILHHSKIWEASGHVKSFYDLMIECQACHKRVRADQHPDLQLIEGRGIKLTKEKLTCPFCEKEMQKIAKIGELSEEERKKIIRPFNLMFKTFVGPVEDSSEPTYLRPETAQGIFINFQNVFNSTRVKIPFGIAQIGKGFRNEITTGNFLFRVREFEMMELEYFVKPQDSTELFEYWKKQRFNWYLDLGIKKENIKLVDLPKEEISHYSKGTTEIWYNWPFMGFGELEGIANRGDYDLSQHSKTSGKDLSYFDQDSNERYIPYVIEPSVGVGRAMLAFLLDSYIEKKKRIVLKLHPRLTPVKVAVFPLLANKSDLIKMAKVIYRDLKKEIGSVAFDDRGNIGKRYLSQDEIGTPWCVTVDFQSLEDQTVTVRDRDTTKQERIKIEKLKDYFLEKLI